MVNLIVRNIDDEIARALKAKAGLHGLSAKRARGLTAVTHNIKDFETKVVMF